MTSSMNRLSLAGRPRWRDERGIGLIELAMVMVIMGVLIAIAMPSVHNYIALQELRSNAREVVEVLREARESALDEGVPRVVFFEQGGQAYQVRMYNGSAWVPDGLEQMLGQSVEFSKVQFPPVNASPFTSTVTMDAAAFDTRGRYPSSHGGKYEVVLSSRMGREITIQLFAETGGVKAT